MKKRMQKKGALELSVTTIIIVVIGVVLLSLGLVFVKDIFSRLGGVSEKTFAGAETVLGEMSGTDTRLNVQSTIEVKQGKTVRIPIKICNVEGQGGSLKLSVLADKVSNSGLTINIPEVDGIKEIKSDGQKVGNKAETLDAGSCATFQMYVSAESNAPITVGVGPTLTMKVMKTAGGEYASAGSIIIVKS